MRKNEIVKKSDRKSEISEAQHEILFESLVEELLKDKPDSRKVKTLCGKLGLTYVKNTADQIDHLIKNGSKIYLKSKNIPLEH